MLSLVNLSNLVVQVRARYGADYDANAVLILLEGLAPRAKTIACRAELELYDAGRRSLALLIAMAKAKAMAVAMALECALVVAGVRW